VQVISATIDAKKYFKKQELHVGIDVSYNNVNSTAIGRNIVTGTLTPITTRYPDGKNTMSYYAIYAQHTVKFTDKLTLNQGIRLNGVNLQSQFIDTSITKFPFNRATINSLAPTGNIGLVYASKNIRTALLLSSGFRAPNIDDMTKVFDSRPGTVVVPNEKLKPEYTYNIEWNINKIAGKFTYGGSVFYTFFTNAIVVAPFTFLGNDSIMYSGVKSKVFANQNRNKAFINGASVNAAYAILPSTSVSAILTYTYGRFTQNNQQVPLDHIPPVYGRVALTHTAKHFSAEINALFNGWKRLKNYNTDGEDNLVYATKDGMPSWVTLNAIVSTTIAKKLALQLGIENIFDANYRYFASGISAPGRNATLGVRMKM
jgi:hemoglobin/transferrin/lactoferrin receptor protein